MAGSRRPAPGAAPPTDDPFPPPRQAAAPSAPAPRATGRDPYADPYATPDPFDAPEREPAIAPRATARPTRAPRPSAPDPDDPTDPSAWDGVFEDPFGDDAGDDLPVRGEAPAPVRRRPAGAPRGARPVRPSIALPQVRLPASLTAGDLLADRVALALLGAALLGALLMALALATQAGRLPAVFVQHLDAAGFPDRWGSPRVLWRLPLIAFGVALMNGVLAWFLAPLDRFVARFVLAAALVVQLVAWIALFDFV